MSQPRIQRYAADHGWVDGRWQANLALSVDADGRIVDASDGDAINRLGHWVLPGMPNLHSHAFQRAMAGRAERRGRTDDSFWSWRETMYAFAARIGPEQLQAIAAQLYVEMLKSGYTHVCEFHYLHQQPNGSPYAQPELMSLALIEAAREAGIGLTLLPVLYMSGGFDGRPLSPRQRRFGLSVEAYLQLLQRLRVHANDRLQIGIALHSLRAVPPAAMHDVLASDEAHGLPIHIHIAEQLGEVQDCLAIRGARPVEWLFDHVEVDRRWTLVHATHLNEHEIVQIARSGAIVGLCPSTEANLGDGLFPLAAFLDAQGHLGIGSDSHISVSPVEELRWLEYGQRLATHHRNIAARQQGVSVGESLWQAALAGGARATGAAIGDLSAAHRADLLVLDEASPLLAAHDATSMMDAFVFAGNTPLVRDVMCAGRWVVQGFHHPDEERIAARYRDAVLGLTAAAG